MRKPWEHWELDMLRAARFGELPALARSLNRSVSSVRTKHSRTCPDHRERRWTTAEDVRAMRLWSEGATLADIGAAVGRSADAVKKRLAVLGAPRRRDLRPWTDDEIAVVLQPGDREIQEVAAELGRSRDGAYSVRARYGRE